MIWFEPPPAPAPPPLPPEVDPSTLARIDAVVARLGFCPGTRPRVSARYRGRPSKSRRDGYRPNAAEHVRRFLLYEAAGVSAASLAAAAKVEVSTVYESIRVGRRLCQANARKLGLDPLDLLDDDDDQADDL